MEKEVSGRGLWPTVVVVWWIDLLCWLGEEENVFSLQMKEKRNIK